GLVRGLLQSGTRVALVLPGQARRPLPAGLTVFEAAWGMPGGGVPDTPPRGRSRTSRGRRALQAAAPPPPGYLSPPPSRPGGRPRVGLLLSGRLAPRRQTGPLPTGASNPRAASAAGLRQRPRDRRPALRRVFRPDRRGGAVRRDPRPRLADLPRGSRSAAGLGPSAPGTPPRDGARPAGEPAEPIPG